MRFRFWVVIHTAIARLRFLNQRPDDPQHDRNRSEPTKTPSDNGQQPIPSVPDAEWAALQALIREIHESEKHHQEAERKLGTAQLRTAKGLNKVTAIGAAVGIIGAIGIVGSLIIAKQGANDAHESFIAANRAWVGPIDAHLDAIPQVGIKASVTISVQNSGKTPGTNGNTDITPSVISMVDDQSGKTKDIISNYITNCFKIPVLQHGRTFYPVSGFGSGYEGHADFDGDKIDWDVLYGNKFLFIQGCLAYTTFKETHHSAFCFFYRAGLSQIQHLSICGSGSEAD